MAERSQVILETFQKFDPDGSGCIDREELAAVLKALEGKFDNKTVDSLLLQADSSLGKCLAALISSFSIYAMVILIHPYKSVYVVDALFVLFVFQGWTTDLPWHLLCTNCTVCYKML